jgi:glycine/betaine/sarcosine/D-proline reductase family selenoprotein B
MTGDLRPIGVMDSGVGGISVLKKAVEIMPDEDFIYYGDSLNAPYGTKSIEEIKDLTFAVSEKLRAMGIKALCVACNTATAAAIKDLSKANIAMLNTSGIVPVDNPDRIQSASATRWGRYDITGMDRLEKGVFKTIHAGFDPAAANEDPNVIMPIDAMRAYEREGKIGRLHPYFYTTVGTGTTEAEARRMAKEIIPFLQEDHVDGVIMLST